MFIVGIGGGYPGYGGFNQGYGGNTIIKIKSNSFDV